MAGSRRLHRIAHLGDQPVAQTVAAGLEQGREAPLGEGALPQLRLEEPPGIGDGQGLVDEAECPVQVVFLQVREEHVGLPAPGLEQAVDVAEARIAGLGEERLQDAQPGVAAGLHHEVCVPRPLGDDQGLVHAVGADRGQDAVVSRGSRRVAGCGRRAGSR